MDGCSTALHHGRRQASGHPNSTFECTHLGAMCHDLWPSHNPPLPNPFPASWPLRCSSNPSLTPASLQFFSPRADVSQLKASSWRQTERQVSHIWKRSQGFSKELSPQSVWVCGLKVWLTITYNVSFEIKVIVFFCSEVSLWAEDLGSIRKNLVLLWDLASSCRMREWVASQVFPNEFLLSLASTLEVQRKV